MSNVHANFQHNSWSSGWHLFCFLLRFPITICFSLLCLSLKIQFSNITMNTLVKCWVVSCVRVYFVLVQKIFATQNSINRFLFYTMLIFYDSSVIITWRTSIYHSYCHFYNNHVCDENGARAKSRWEWEVTAATAAGIASVVVIVIFVVVRLNLDHL